MKEKMKWVCIVILAIFTLFLGNQIRELKDDVKYLASYSVNIITELESWKDAEKIALEHYSKSISNLELAELQNSELIKLYHERMKLTEEIQDIIMRRLGMK